MGNILGTRKSKANTLWDVWEGYGIPEEMKEG